MSMGTGPIQPGGPERNGDDMSFDQIAAALAVAAFVITVLAALGFAALRFGADSRPGIGDRDQRPWLVPGH